MPLCTRFSAAGGDRADYMGKGWGHLLDIEWIDKTQVTVTQNAQPLNGVRATMVSEVRDSHPQGHWTLPFRGPALKRHWLIGLAG